MARVRSFSHIRRRSARRMDALVYSLVILSFCFAVVAFFASSFDQKSHREQETADMNASPVLWEAFSQTPTPVSLVQDERRLSRLLNYQDSEAYEDGPSDDLSPPQFIPRLVPKRDDDPSSEAWNEGVSNEQEALSQGASLIDEDVPPLESTVDNTHEEACQHDNHASSANVGPEPHPKETISNNEPPSLQMIPYIVKRGDTLDRLSRNFRVSISKLVRRNGISNRDKIFYGQKIWIPVLNAGPIKAKTQSGLSEPETVQQPKKLFHKVRSGDRLERLAKAYGISLQQIVRWNSIADPDRIYIGQIIFVSSVSA